MTELDDLRRLRVYLSRLPLDYSMSSEEFGYSNPVLICCDAVLSINRHYSSFVAPRIQHIRTEWPQLDSLERLVRAIASMGFDGFCEVWMYKHPARVEVLNSLALKYVDMRLPEQSELAAMRSWAREVAVDGYREFGVKGIGLATYQYLRMMLGASTVKPDVHITRAVEEALGRRVTPAKCIRLLEMTAAKMGLNAVSLDHALWRSRATGAAEGAAASAGARASDGSHKSKEAR